MSTIGVLVPQHLLTEVQVAVAALQNREALEAASRPAACPGERSGLNGATVVPWKGIALHSIISEGPENCVAPSLS